ncbi:MAG: hypothetical protein DYG89_15045 [Caldilinea sp. CFX5]|nr:hypothetical protein [Caldilinea sp. CFX5]
MTTNNHTTPPRSPETSWAKPVDRLAVGDLPADAVNLNVDRRHLSGPVRGFGQLWQKSYRITFAGAAPAPDEVIREWKTHFSEFWPPGHRFFATVAAIKPGDVAVLNLAGPGGVSIPGGAPLIATGVMVIYADDESFSFMTSEGHPFAGLITFSAAREDDQTRAQIQALVRANDPLYELMMRLGMSKVEDEFWCATLQQLAAHFGATGQPIQQSVLVDTQVRWREAKNIWHNAALRTALYTLTAPLRWLKRACVARVRR